MIIFSYTVTDKGNIIFHHKTVLNPKVQASRSNRLPVSDKLGT